MIAFVDGILEGCYEDKAIINVNGIGYNVLVSARTVSMLPNDGENIRLYTYMCVREDSVSLYGFFSLDELNLFKKLISVNGIGPKGGLALLSYTDPDELRYAIVSGNVKLISSAPGIGKKTAERIILDLKDKIDYEASMIQREVNDSLNLRTDESDVKKVAKEALTALGYSMSQAQKAVNMVSDDITDDEEVLKEALKYLI